IHYHDASAAEIQAVQNITSRDELIAAYNQAVTDVVNRPEGYTSTDNGPANRVRRMEAGSIVFFKSSSRDLHAIMIVNEVTPSVGGNGREVVDMSVRSTLVL